MAHKKGVGSSKNGRDSNPNRLGVKRADGQKIRIGSIIVRQRGTKVHPGKNVKKGNDDTLFATADGIVKTSKYYGSFGHYIEIDHGNGYVTCYGHLHQRKQTLLHPGTTTGSKNQIRTFILYRRIDSSNYFLTNH